MKNGKSFLFLWVSFSAQWKVSGETYSCNSTTLKFCECNVFTIVIIHLMRRRLICTLTPRTAGMEMRGFSFSISCQCWHPHQEGSHNICICINIPVKNFPKVLTERKKPEWEIPQGKRFNATLIRKVITFVLDLNAYPLRSAITYDMLGKSPSGKK